MSVLTSLRSSVAKSPPPAELASALALAQAGVADLEASYGAAALDAFAKAPGAGATLEDLNRKLLAGREQVATLKAAHAAAIRREQDALAASRAALQKTQLAACRKHIEARNATAIKLSEAIADAAKAYRELQERSAKARAATPIGMTFPMGANFETDTLRNLVIAELWRASAQPGDADQLALPGAHYPHVNFQHNPGAVPALADTIKKGSDFALRQLKAPE